MKRFFAAALGIVTASLFIGVAFGGPTTGFHLISDSYSVQKPYNLNVSDRFSVANGVYTCWVFGNDQPFSQGSTTGPRTEMRWKTWPQQDRENMFECDAMFDAGTSHTCIHQIKSNTAGEANYLQVNQAGTLRNSVGANFASGIAGTWFHINSSFNPATGLHRIWLNGSLKVSGNYSTTARDWYFKNGTYSNGITATARSWAQFKNIRHWVK
jgi:hypothetical protein